MSLPSGIDTALHSHSNDDTGPTTACKGTMSLPHIHVARVKRRAAQPHRHRRNGQYLSVSEAAPPARRKDRTEVLADNDEEGAQA